MNRAETAAEQRRYAKMVDQLLDLNPNPALLLDAEGQLERLNSAAAQLASSLGINGVWRSLEEILPEAEWSRLKPDFSRLLEDGEALTSEVCLGKSEHSSLKARLSFHPIIAVGRVEGAVGILEVRKPDALPPMIIDRFARAIERISEAVIVTDPAGTIEYVNAGFEKITGYARSEVLGRTPSLLKSGRHSASFYRHLWGTIVRGEILRHTIVNRRKNGELFYLEQTITPIRTGETVTHFVSTGRDVTAKFLQEREHDALIALSNSLRKARTRSGMVPIILRQVSERMEAGAAALFEMPPFSAEPRLVEASGAWKELTGPEIRGLADLAALVGETRRTVSSSDLQDIQYVELPEEVAGMRLAATPLVANDKSIGILVVGRTTTLPEQDLHLLIAIGELVANALDRCALHEQTEQRLQRLTALHSIDQAITAGLDLHQGLRILLGHVQTQLGIDAATVLLLNPEQRTMDLAASRGFNTRVIQECGLNVGEGYVGKAVLERRIVQVPHLGTNGHYIRNASLAEEQIESYFVAPLIAKERVEGVLEVFSRIRLLPDSEWLAFLEVLATQAAIAIDNATMFDDLKRSHNELGQAYDATIEGWAQALELRDAETQGHARRVTETTLHLSRVLGLPAYKMEHIRRGALLHDIGKLGIPDSILYKPGPLDLQEWKIMRRHPEYAQRMLMHVDYLRPALDIPYCHHERWDGKGYPRGLTETHIPKEARIFAVVDVWDALCYDRPYRKAWDGERALNHIRLLSETHFDPEVVEAFADEITSGRLTTKFNGSLIRTIGTGGNGSGPSRYSQTQ